METMDVGKRIEAIREARDMSQVALSKLVGLNPQTIRDYEKGRRVPTLKGLPSLAKALGVTISHLLGAEDDIPALSHLPPSQVLRKYLSVPDFVVELASKIGPEHEAWAMVRKRLETAEKEMEKAVSKPRHA